MDFRITVPCAAAYALLPPGHTVTHLTLQFGQNRMARREALRANMPQQARRLKTVWAAFLNVRWNRGDTLWCVPLLMTFKALEYARIHVPEVSRVAAKRGTSTQFTVRLGAAICHHVPARPTRLGNPYSAPSSPAPRPSR